ncbi:MAG: UDP-N-acetylmuramoyl-tripeptide--D-alanyl-D-alanine ligase [Acidobacteria bacterium]|nr:UDP-N-acetylmuramoyl-tripeptide--D-alanyl-D-alanine ligase [Acidobacteriota bacterium]MBV9476205.1 UDP-N-acetylmuramoyl-tripeptide--D-alanyl-D-alanine ligase [Acidobacteriota bacterium]
MKIPFSQLAEMVHGTLVQGGDVESSSVVIDSREVKPGAAFFAIKGERLDGHQFLAQALQTAAGAVVSRVPDDVPPGKGIVKVDDTTEALQQLAKSIRDSSDFLVIGITGSAGKTTTKEMIATVVATERRTHKSWGNFNNQIGAPLCLDNVPDGAEVVVSEMGMNHAGEIAQIAGLMRPHVGVYTNIAPVHIEFFGTIEGIAAAKRELLENVVPGGTIIINNDNEHVVRISRDFEGRRVTYAVEHEAEYRATNIRERGLLGTRFTLEAEGAARDFDLALPGRHNLDNLLAAIATARAIGISWESIERGVRDVKPAYHRGVIVEWRGATIYDDTYNSNPYALQRTLELMTQAETRGRRIAVIGDMLELGEQELQFHRDAGRGIPKAVDVVLGVGKRTRALLEGAREAGFDENALHYFGNAQDAGAFLMDEIRDGDLVLIKGSRGVGLDKIVTMLEGAP